MNYMIVERSFKMVRRTFCHDCSLLGTTLKVSQSCQRLWILVKGKTITGNNSRKINTSVYIAIGFIALT